MTRPPRRRRRRCAPTPIVAPPHGRAQWPLFVFKSKVACLYNCPPTQSLLIVFLREHRQSIPHFKNYYYMLLWHQIIMNKQLQMKKKIILCPFYCCLTYMFWLRSKYHYMCPKWELSIGLVKEPILSFRISKRYKLGSIYGLCYTYIYKR